jgi:hypothetical protein
MVFMLIFTRIASWGQRVLVDEFVQVADIPLGLEPTLERFSGAQKDAEYFWFSVCIISPA